MESITLLDGISDNMIQSLLKLFLQSWYSMASGGMCLFQSRVSVKNSSIYNDVTKESHEVFCNKI